MGSRVLGIDEAGRGSVLGPLVVGGFLTERSRLDELSTLGVRDSKLLSPERREHLFNALQGLGERIAIPIPPSQVDAAVHRGELNLLEAKVFARLLSMTDASEVYVDACDPRAERFGRRVKSLARTPARIVSAHHADRDLPIVSAASIVAKVCRDRAVSRLRLRLESDFGSGYPSDAKTQRFVKDHLSTTVERVSWLRYSWATIEKFKPRPRLRTLDTAWP
ncbi:MAG: ribonuclease HII [Thermoplasmata archaeon]|nr:ribonuclease HII [Thermoplasmata archaeon]